MSKRIAITVAVAVIFTARVAAAEPPVTVIEDGSTYTLANGIVTAKVAKRSGDLVSLRFKKLELLTGGSESRVWRKVIHEGIRIDEYGGTRRDRGKSHRDSRTPHSGSRATCSTVAASPVQPSRPEVAWARLAPVCTVT